MDDLLAQLVETAEDLRQAQTLEQLLQLVVDRARAFLGTGRASVRLLDASGTRLLPHSRAGAPLHDAPAEFLVGEGFVGWVAQNLQSLRSENADLDPRFASRPGMQEPVQSFLGVPLLTKQSCVGVLSAVHPAPQHFTLRHQRILQLLATLSAPHLEVARLARLARTNPLTGALNRLGFDDVVQPAALERPVSIAVCDIDHFKTINDRWGHAVGDEVLRRLTTLLGGALRTTDSVVRWGGEEFVLVLPGVELDRARRIAERARFHVQEELIELGPARVSVTISVGVAEHRPGEEREQTIRRADEALYLAKSSGRNCVAEAP